MRGNFSKEQLNSAARVLRIKKFYPLQVNFVEQNDGTVSATFDNYTYYDSASLSASIVSETCIRYFPILIQGDGDYWNLGNLFLISFFDFKAEYNEFNLQTIVNKAEHLIMYRRWIEHQQSSSKKMKVHELYFPKRRGQRVTYAYRNYLMTCVQNRTLAFNTAKTRMQTVVNFYRFLFDQNLVPRDACEHEPFIEKAITIPYYDSTGVARTVAAVTTDLNLKGAKQSATDHHGVIFDGSEKLRPLEQWEQELLISALREMGNRTHELMHWVALYTGARKQTVGTLRIDNLMQAYAKYKQQSVVELKVGKGTGIDTKGNKLYRLHFPTPLVEALLNYANSSGSKERREKSYYGDQTDNYLFLNRDGNPFYTSKKEIVERSSPDYSKRLKSQYRLADMQEAKGLAFNNYTSRITQHIQQTRPDFVGYRFHDLRATYGMNFVRTCVSNSVDSTQVFEELRNRMGHNNVQTTLGYLEFDEKNAVVKHINEQVERLIYDGPWSREEVES